MPDLHDTYEQRGAAYQVLEALSVAERGILRQLRIRDLGTASIQIAGVALDVQAVHTVLHGNDAERYLALFPNHWGRGGSVAEALAKAKEHGARSRDYYVMKMPAGTYGAHVDMFGNWSFFWALDAEFDAAPVCVATSGMAKGKMTITAEA